MRIELTRDASQRPANGFEERGEQQLQYIPSVVTLTTRARPRGYEEGVPIRASSFAFRSPFMFGRYPTVRSAGLPSLKMITVGIDIMPSDIGVAGFSSMSIFMILTLSPSSPWICSTIGAIMRHGPHQVAQKSTSTGMSDFNTRLSNSPSVTPCTFDI